MQISGEKRLDILYVKRPSVKTAGHDGKAVADSYGYIAVSGFVLSIWHIDGDLRNYGRLPVSATPDTRHIVTLHKILIL